MRLIRYMKGIGHILENKDMLGLFKDRLGLLGQNRLKDTLTFRDEKAKKPQIDEIKDVRIAREKYDIKIDTTNPNQPNQSNNPNNPNIKGDSYLIKHLSRV